ncbi:MAG: type II toxin-antitoxin system HicA family toxin [Rhodanobacteraceae bacterium]
MKLPRDVDAHQLIKALARLGYRVTRQTGSHIRLSCAELESHSITVPNHSPLKVGTLNAILSDVAAHLRIDKADLIRRLFA